MGRVVLEGVPRAGFYNGDGNPEDYPLPGVMRVWLEFLGDDCGFPGRTEDANPWRWNVCALMHGVTGTAFRFMWNEPGPEPAYTGPDLPLIYRRAFEAVGYQYEMLLKEDFAEPLNHNGPASSSEEDFRRRIIESIRDRGRPVVAIGVIGPPEPCIITGYENNGEALIGWNYFQDWEKSGNVSIEPTGQFRKTNWFPDTLGTILIGDKVSQSQPEGLYRDTLRSALTTLCVEDAGGRSAGIASFTHWAESLLDDSLYPVDDPEELHRRHDTHHNAVGDLAERRAYGGTFLHQAADHEPAARSELKHAAACYQTIHDLMWRLWQSVGGWIRDENSDARFAQPEVRREAASIIRLAQVKDAEAIGHIRRALVKLGDAPVSLPAMPELPVPPAGVRDIYSEFPCPAGAANVQHQHVGFWVEGVPKFDWWKSNVCSFANSLQAAMAATPHPYSYSDLMGYSGLAFRTRWFHNPEGAETTWGTGRWHPVSPHGEQAREIEALSRATGWQLRMLDLPQDDRLARERLTTNVVASINAGLPVVVGCNTDLGVAYGYHIHSMSLFMRDVQQSDKDDVRIPHTDTKLHSPYIFLTRHEEPAPEAEAFGEALAIAVRNGKREKENGFLFGPAALRAWSEDIAGWDGYSGKEQEWLYMVSSWCLMHLVDARKAAVQFLEARMSSAPGGRSEAIGRALSLYRQESELLTSFLDANRGYVMWLGGSQCASEWSAEARQAQSRMLEAAADIEDLALAALEAAGRM